MLNVSLNPFISWMTIYWLKAPPHPKSICTNAYTHTHTHTHTYTQSTLISPLCLSLFFSFFLSVTMWTSQQMTLTMVPTILFLLVCKFTQPWYPSHPWHFIVWQLENNTKKHTDRSTKAICFNKGRIESSCSWQKAGPSWHYQSQKPLLPSDMWSLAEHWWWRIFPHASTRSLQSAKDLWLFANYSQYSKIRLKCLCGLCIDSS